MTDQEIRVAALQAACTWAGGISAGRNNVVTAQVLLTAQAFEEYIRGNDATRLEEQE